MKQGIRLVLFFLFILLMPITYGAISTNVADAIPLNSTITIDISSNATSCTTKFYANNGSTIYRNESLSFTIPNQVHGQKGIYKVKTNCTDGTVYTKLYFVTKSGELPASDNLQIFIYLLFIISIIGLFYAFFINIVRLASLETTIFDLLVSWGFYFLLWIVIWLAQNYFLNTLIEDFSDIMIYGFATTNVLLPLISLAIIWFANSLIKQRPPNVKEMYGRLQ